MCETDVQHNCTTPLIRFLKRRVRQAERPHGERRIDAHQRRDLEKWIPLDTKVQAVDNDGNVVSLTSDVFKAIKPEEVGSLVRFDFNAESSAKLRFSFGCGLDGTWTPIEMPFLAVTLLDTSRPL